MGVHEYRNVFALQPRVFPWLRRFTDDDRVCMPAVRRSFGFARMCGMRGFSGVRLGEISWRKVAALGGLERGDVISAVAVVKWSPEIAMGRGNMRSQKRPSLGLQRCATVEGIAAKLRFGRPPTMVKEVGEVAGVASLMNLRDGGGAATFAFGVRSRRLLEVCAAGLELPGLVMASVLASIAVWEQELDLAGPPLDWTWIWASGPRFPTAEA
ncbi:hypothetical protein ACLB2K_046647 [Fragaria x ananassa]